MALSVNSSPGSEWLLFGLVLLLLFGAWLLYFLSWRRMQSRMGWFATKGRLLLATVAASLAVLLFLPALNHAAAQWMTVRALQQVLACLIIPPLFWLASPYTVLRGGELAKQSGLNQWMPRARTSGDTVKWLLSPGVAWMYFIGAFALWHEPQLVRWGLTSLGRHYMLLALLLTGSLTLWMHVIGSGPRVRRPLPGWSRFLLLIGAEIPNMIAGVLIAFSGSLIYEIYGPMQDAIPFLAVDSRLADQRTSGIIIWILGTVIYLSTGFGVLNHWFKINDFSVPTLRFETEPDERYIAPGLEQRVVKTRWYKVLSDA